MSTSTISDLQRLAPGDVTDIGVVTEADPYVLFGGRLSGGPDSGPVKPWVTSHLGGTPGEPVRVKWRFHAGNAAVGGTVTARIEYDSHVLYTSPPIAVRNRNVLIQNVDVVVESEAVALLFYKMGPKTIRLVVTGDAGPSYTAELEWTIASPVLEAGWTSPWVGWDTSEMSVAWHDDFTLNCKFVNQMPYTSLSVVHVRLAESTLNWHYAIEGEANAYADQWDLGSPVVAGTELPHTFAIPGKTWFWRDGLPDFAVSAGGHFKYHRYSAFITMTDIYGNVYPEISAVGPEVLVTVSDKKEDYAHVAMLAATTAAGLTAVSFIPACAILASLAWGSALAANIVANNHPPDADRSFMDRVELNTPAGPSVEPPLEAGDRYFSLMSRLFASERALKAIHAKFLGAAAAGSAEGKRLQTSRYLEVEQSLNGLMAELTTTTSEVKRSLAETGAFTSDNLRSGIAKLGNGLPAEFRASLGDAGVDQDIIAQLNDAVMNPKLRQSVLDSSDSLPPFDKLTQAMKLATESILRSRPSEIAGQ